MACDGLSTATRPAALQTEKNNNGYNIYANEMGFVS